MEYGISSCLIGPGATGRVVLYNVPVGHEIARIGATPSVLHTPFTTTLYKAGTEGVSLCDSRIHDIRFEVLGASTPALLELLAIACYTLRIYGRPPGSDAGSHELLRYTGMLGERPRRTPFDVRVADSVEVWITLDREYTFEPVLVRAILDIEPER
jgi:hypothetical protein